MPGTPGTPDNLDTQEDKDSRGTLDMERRHKAVADSQGTPDTQDMHTLGGRDNLDMREREAVSVVLVVLNMVGMAERLSVALALAVHTHFQAEHRVGMEGMEGMRVKHLFHVLDAKNPQGDCSHQVFVMVALTDLVAPIALVCVLALTGKLPRADEYPRLVVPMILPIAQMLDADVFDWGRMLTLYIQNSR